MHGEDRTAEVADRNFRGVGGRVIVSCKREIPIHLKTLNDEMVPGTITSVELADTDAPLPSLAAERWCPAESGSGDRHGEPHHLQPHAGQGVGADYAQWFAFRRTYPGEPGLGNIVLNAIEEQHDIQDILQNDHVVEDDDTVKYVDTVSEDENKKVNKGGSDYMPISEGKVEIMTRRQRKHLQESLDEVEKEDCAMWSTLSPNYKRPRRMLPQGCKSFLMEIFAGVATLSCIAVVKLGLKMSAAIDVAYDDRYNLLKKSNRDYLEKLVEDEDPFLLSLAPVCGRWSSWQYVNMSKDEDTREKIIQQRKEWYPVLQCVAKIIRSRLAKGREVLAENPWPSLLWRLRCVEDLTAEPVYKASGAGED